MTKNKKILLAVGIIALIVIIALIFALKNEKAIYTVTFNSNGGSAVASQSVEEGMYATKPQDPIREGYIFIEWLLDGKSYNFNSIVNKNIILKASWQVETPEKELVIVKFDSDGGTTISNQVIEKGNKVTKPVDPVKEGYTFKGWILNNEIYDFEKNVENDLELKAEWEKNEVVENKPNNSGNNSKPATKPNNSSIQNKPTTPSTPSIPTTPTTPTVNKYTVTFNSNGGSAVSAQTIKEGEKASRPTDPTKSGHTFAGWLLNGSVFDFNSVIKGNITLTAKWNENEKAKYTVTFNSNGGSAVSAQTITEGGKASRPSDPTRSGYNFGGWLLNGSAYDFNSTVNGNITLTAKWNQKTYIVRVTPVDQYSPDRILSVYEEGTPISVSAIKYNGATLCNGSNMVVNMYEITGISSVTVVLTNGTNVTASVQ